MPHGTQTTDAKPGCGDTKSKPQGVAHEQDLARFWRIFNSNILYFNRGKIDETLLSRLVGSMIGHMAHDEKGGAASLKRSRKSAKQAGKSDTPPEEHPPAVEDRLEPLPISGSPA
ncbi:MAG: hypothetical protein HQL76_12065 [Magnetococcales bacterium]|nr:hypothetical protein [Magnetococcales bacterium]